VFNVLIEPSFPLIGSSEVRELIVWCKIRGSVAFFDGSLNSIFSQICARDFGKSTVLGFTSSE